VRLPWIRWIALATLATAEAAALSIRFDTGSLGDPPAGWAVLPAAVPVLTRLTIVVLFVTALVLGRTLLSELHREPARTRVAAGRCAWLLAAHFACLAVFVWATAEVLERGRAAGPGAPFWTLGWVAAGLLALAAWAAAVLPGVLWLRLAAQSSRALAATTCVAVAAYWVGQSLEKMWEPFAAGTFWSVSGLLNLVYADVACDPTRHVISAGAFEVEIAPQCSGYEGMGLAVVFLAAYLWFDRRNLRFPHALVLVPLGALAAWAANVARLAALVAIGASWSPAIALGGFHSQAGWLAFNCVALGLIAVARRLRFFSVAHGPRAEAGPNPAAPYLVPFLAVVATGMATAALSDGFDGLYPLRVAAAAAALWWFRGQYARVVSGGMTPHPSPLTPHPIVGRVVSGGVVGGGETPDPSPITPHPSVGSVVSGGVVSGGSTPHLSPLTPHPSPITSLAAGAAVFGVWLLLASQGENVSPAAGLADWPPAWGFVWWVSKVAGYLFVAPFVEELAFRGFLARRLIAADFEAVPLGRFTWFSFLASSLAFGFLHGGQWVAGTLAGMTYALVLHRRGRLVDAVLAHATTNALLAIYAPLSGNWSVWS